MSPYYKISYNLGHPPTITGVENISLEELINVVKKHDRGRDKEYVEDRFDVSHGFAFLPDNRYEKDTVKHLFINVNLADKIVAWMDEEYPDRYSDTIKNITKKHKIDEYTSKL